MEVTMNANEPTPAPDRSELDKLWAKLLSSDEPLWLTLPSVPDPPPILATTTPLPAAIATAELDSDEASVTPQSVTIATPPVDYTIPIAPEPDGEDIDEIFTLLTTDEAYETDDQADVIGYFTDYLDDRPLAEILAEMSDSPRSARSEIRSAYVRATSRWSLGTITTHLQLCAAEQGGVYWRQLVRSVQQSGADPFRAHTIAEHLCQGNISIIEHPAKMGSFRKPIPDDELAACEEIARRAFADLPRQPLIWQLVARRLGPLSRKASADIHPRLIDYFALHQLSRTEEQEIFASLEELRRAYPHLDPRDREEVDDDTRCQWRNIPTVAMVYNTVCTDQLWLAARIALRHASRRMSFDDLLQEGCIGLLRAIDTFDPATGNRFVTYAGNWVRQRILRAIEEQDNVIPIPVHALQDYREAQRRQQQLTQQLKRRPSDDELEAAMGMKRGMWRRFVALRNVRSLQHCPAALQVASDELEPSEVGEQVALQDAIAKSLSLLVDRERQIVELRFGLNDGRQRTLEEVAQNFNLTRERIRQIEAEILRKLTNSKYGGSELGGMRDKGKERKAKLSRATREDSGGISKAATIGEQIATIIHTVLHTPRIEPEQEWGRSILHKILNCLIETYPRLHLLLASPQSLRANLKAGEEQALPQCNADMQMVLRDFSGYLRFYSTILSGDMVAREVLLTLSGLIMSSFNNELVKADTDKTKSEVNPYNATNLVSRGRLHA